MFIIRKFEGNDSNSWAVFKKSDLPKGHRGIVFWGEARPVVCGLSRSEADHHKKRLGAK